MTRYHIGLDAVNISRSERLSDHFIERFFHPEEIAKAKSITNSRRKAEYIASRFAAKEAYSKAIGKGLVGLNLNEIEVATLDSGKPVLILHGKTLEAFEQAYPDGILDISISHEDPLALAIVMITYEEAEDGQI